MMQKSMSLTNAGFEKVVEGYERSGNRLIQAYPLLPHKFISSFVKIKKMLTDNGFQ